MTANDIQHEIEETLAAARRAIDEDGVTDRALQRIQVALHRLAQSGAVNTGVDLRSLHQGDAAATVLASDGPDGLTLVLARFPPEAPTPVHDHGTWGVAYVVAGHDTYVHWDRLDDGQDSGHAQLRVKYERLLDPGDSVYWLGPSGDIHHQQGADETAWELVMFGKNVMLGARHYFDPATGRVTTALPQT